MYREGPPYQRQGSLQLWQFLVTLLDDPANAHFIAWTGRGMEFKLIEPEEVSPGVSITSLLIMYRGLQFQGQVRVCHGGEAGQQAVGMSQGHLWRSVLLYAGLKLKLPGWVV